MKLKNRNGLEMDCTPEPPTTGLLPVGTIVCSHMAGRAIGMIVAYADYSGPLVYIVLWTDGYFGPYSLHSFTEGWVASPDNWRKMFVQWWANIKGVQGKKLATVEVTCDDLLQGHADNIAAIICAVHPTTIASAVSLYCKAVGIPDRTR